MLIGVPPSCVGRYVRVPFWNRVPRLVTRLRRSDHLATWIGHHALFTRATARVSSCISTTLTPRTQRAQRMRTVRVPRMRCANGALYIRRSVEWAG